MCWFICDIPLYCVGCVGFSYIYIMAVYTSTSCGSCGTDWEVWEYGRKSKLGSPLVKCKVCKTVNKTSSKLYRDMNFFQKIIFWSNHIISSSLFAISGLAFGIGVAFYAEDWEGWTKYIVLVLSMIFAFYQFKEIYIIPKAIKSLEEIFDEKGFLWSDEEY